jgi:hypothetical protein
MDMVLSNCHILHPPIVVFDSVIGRAGGVSDRSVTGDFLARPSRSANALTTKARKDENTKGRQLKFFNESIEDRRKKKKHSFI